MSVISNTFRCYSFSVNKSFAIFQFILLFQRQVHEEQVINVFFRILIINQTSSQVEFCGILIPLLLHQCYKLRLGKNNTVVNFYKFIWKFLQLILLNVSVDSSGSWEMSLSFRHILNLSVVYYYLQKVF